MADRRPPQPPAEHLMPPTWTLEQVAARYDLSLTELQRDAAAGKFAHVHRGRKRWMTAEQIEAFFAMHTVDGDKADPEAATRDRLARVPRQRRSDAA